MAVSTFNDPDDTAASAASFVGYFASNSALLTTGETLTGATGADRVAVAIVLALLGWWLDLVSGVCRSPGRLHLRTEIGRERIIATDAKKAISLQSGGHTVKTASIPARTRGLCKHSVFSHTGHIGEMEQTTPISRNADLRKPLQTNYLR
jgi:hypothetical protein